MTSNDGLPVHLNSDQYGHINRVCHVNCDVSSFDKCQSILLVSRSSVKHHVGHIYDGIRDQSDTSKF